MLRDMPLPFEFTPPQREAVPLLFNSPHSGRYYPQSFLNASRLDPHAIRQSEDMFVDDLLANAPALGAAVMAAHYPRAYVDLNRAPYELEPSLFTDSLPPHIDRHSARAAAGLGTVPRLVAENTPIYDKKLSFAEAEKRIETIYHPFHRRLADEMTRLHGAHGYAVLIDTHSMPSQATRLSADDRQVDFVIGDRFGRSCAPELSDWISNFLTARDWHVTRNKPYAGGFITSRYGKPGEGHHAVQIEINRAIYMDENGYEKHAGFAELQAQLTDMIGELLAVLPLMLDRQTGTQSAAE
jgi:N-formylglutamate amidohydrolase